MNNCTHCGPTSLVIRARGLCDRCYYTPAVRQKYHGSRSQTRREWTAREMRDLAQWRLERVPVAAIARRLGRPVTAVNMACHREGLRFYVRDLSRSKRVRALHAQGLSDQQVADRLSCTRSTAARWRESLGLAPAVGKAEGARRSMRSSRQRYGVLLSKRWLEERIAAAKAGWPSGCTGAQFRVLELLRVRPLRAVELSVELGMTNRNSVYRTLTKMKGLGWINRERGTWKLAPGVGSRHAPLTAEQQLLVESAIAQAEHIAHKRAMAYPSLAEDFESAAMLGLVYAARLFDPSRGVKFSSYVTTGIEGAITDWQRDQGLKGFKRDMRNAPVAVFGITDEFDAWSGEEDHAEATDGIDGLVAMTAGLPKVERRAVQLHFASGWTFARIGRALGLSESRVSQIVASGLDRLRQQPKGACK